MNKKKITKVLIIVFGLVIFIGITLFVSITSTKSISGIENYRKEYYLKEYFGDLDSNLSIFPNNELHFIDAKFHSLFKTGLFDSNGYILLATKYSEEDFYNEVNRLSKIKITLSESCYKNSLTHTNYIRYDEKSYEYPTYVSIDGFAHTYEYALINEVDLEIIYVYLAYPSKDNPVYNQYLKKDKTEYSKTNTLDLYSIYNHSFDDGESFVEYSDC